MTTRARVDRIADLLRLPHDGVDPLTDDQRAERIAALADRAAAGDPDAVRRFARVQELLAVARDRRDRGADT